MTAAPRITLPDSVTTLENYDGDPNIVEVYVGYLRRKLEQDGEPRLLHTVRGVGFVLRPGT